VTTAPRRGRGATIGVELGMNINTLLYVLGVVLLLATFAVVAVAND
jgi:hypothetical protein